MWRASGREKCARHMHKRKTAELLEKRGDFSIFGRKLLHHLLLHQRQACVEEVQLCPKLCVCVCVCVYARARALSLSCTCAASWRARSHSASNLACHSAADSSAVLRAAVSSSSFCVRSRTCVRACLRACARALASVRLRTQTDTHASRYAGKRSGEWTADGEVE